MSEETTQEETTTEVAETSSDVMNIEELCDTAKGMQPSGLELVSNYFNFEVGVVNKILPLSVTRIEKLNPSKDDWDAKKDNEDKPMTNAIRFLCVDDGEMYITASAVLVGTLEDSARENKNAEVKKFYQVTCTGKKEGKKGDYQIFSIQSLV